MIEKIGEGMDRLEALRSRLLQWDVEVSRSPPLP